MHRDRKLGWLDFETTGFDDLHNKEIYDHKILEIGLVVTDGHFKPIAKLTLVVHHDHETLMPLCDDVVKAMHTKNGLFAEVAASTLSLAEAERAAIEFLESHGVGPKASPLTGNGISFDRNYLKVHMPALNEHFHYRNFDISAVKEFIKTIEPGLEPAKKLAHRALDDILESIAEAKHYRKLLAPALAAAMRKSEACEP
jgi:oligoribonuclease